MNISGINAHHRAQIENQILTLLFFLFSIAITESEIVVIKLNIGRITYM
jgi:hypothetical protein